MKIAVKLITKNKERNIQYTVNHVVVQIIFGLRRNGSGSARVVDLELLSKAELLWKFQKLLSIYGI